MEESSKLARRPPKRPQRHPLKKPDRIYHSFLGVIIGWTTAFVTATVILMLSLILRAPSYSSAVEFAVVTAFTLLIFVPFAFCISAIVTSVGWLSVGLPLSLVISEKYI